MDAAGAVVAQVGYNAASRVAMQPGDWVVVYGDGIIGQSAAQAARARGARVILVGHRAERVALAAQVQRRCRAELARGMIRRAVKETPAARL